MPKRTELQLAVFFGLNMLNLRMFLSTGNVSRGHSCLRMEKKQYSSKKPLDEKVEYEQCDKEWWHLEG